MLFFKKTIFAILFFFSFVGVTKNLELETEKMRELAAELRCVVCQNQSLLDLYYQVRS